MTAVAAGKFQSHQSRHMLGILLNPGDEKMSGSADLAALAIGDFTPHQDAVFELTAANDAVPLRLVKVEKAGESGRAGGAFSLLFAAPAGTRLPQAIYPVTHPSLGVMEIFLVPIGPRSGGAGYQAIFT